MIDIKDGKLRQYALGVLKGNDNSEPVINFSIPECAYNILKPIIEEAKSILRNRFNDLPR